MLYVLSNFLAAFLDSLRHLMIMDRELKFCNRFGTLAYTERSSNVLQTGVEAVGAVVVVVVVVVVVIVVVVVLGPAGGTRCALVTDGIWL